jgi:GntR family transcriptional regulator / MocR family aminotransferase
VQRASSPSRSWASSRDLFVELDAPGGRRAGLETALRDAIRAGRLKAGERLPSTRALAIDLGVARGTVLAAYEQLAAEGYLTSRQGAPTRVAATPALRAARVPGLGAAAHAPAHDLMPGSPDPSSFPRRLWLGAMRKAIATAPDEALGIGDPQGRIELRRALASYLGRVRGVLADPGTIVICTGYAQALNLLAQALGVRAFAMEDPGFGYHREIVAARGVRVLALPVDELGAVAEVPRGAGAAVVTPAHQFPLGATLAPSRRAALVRWARDTGGVLIEDDYDGEFRFDRQPVGALQGLDPARVVYAGTASKALGPALRIGWLAVPPELVGPIVDAKRLADYQTGALDQLALAALIESGALDRHVRRMRLNYRKRRDRLLEILAEHAPWGRPLGVAAGLHVVLELPPDGPDEAAIVATAARRSVALDRLGHPGRNGVVIGYGRPPDHAYGAAVEALAEVMSACGGARTLLT